MKFIHSTSALAVLAIFVLSFSSPLVLTEAATKRATVAPTPHHIKSGVLIPVGESPFTDSGVYPTRVSIPAINVSAPIQSVGINGKGEMAVPNGKSNNVGWWKDGTVPGEAGSAVLDAHVFAAFSALKKVQSGADIFVTMSDGSTRHFVVSSAKNFALNSLSSNELFRQTDSPDLNLITCSGSLTANHSTYDHRLIVYSTLVQDPNPTN
jgi:sortase A